MREPFSAGYTVSREEIAEQYGEDIRFMDGHDSAFIGVVYRAGKYIACYDVEEIILNLMVNDGMDADEAEEFFSFNIEGAYVGEFTPILLSPFKLGEDK